MWHGTCQQRPTPSDEEGDDFECCGVDPAHQHANCMAMHVSPSDPFYSRFGRTCMEFKRSIAGQRPHCALGPRVHVNTLTSAIDANFLYGSDESLARKLRSFSGGECVCVCACVIANVYNCPDSHDSPASSNIILHQQHHDTMMRRQDECASGIGSGIKG